MVSAMTVVPKNGGKPLSVDELSSLVLKQPSIVHINLTKDQIANIESIENGFVITLADGRKLTIGPIENSEIAISNAQGGFDKVVVKEVDGQTVIDYQGVSEEEEQDKDDDSSLLPLFWWIGGLVGATAIGVSLSDGNGGSSSKDQSKPPVVEVDPEPPVVEVDPEPITPTNPEVPNGGDSGENEATPEIPEIPVTPEPTDPSNPSEGVEVDPSPIDPTEPDDGEKPDENTGEVEVPEIKDPEIDPKPTDPEEGVEPAPEPIVTSPFIDVIQATASQDYIDFRSSNQLLKTHPSDGAIVIKTLANHEVKLTFVDENNGQHEYVVTSDESGIAKFVVETQIQDGIKTGLRTDVTLYNNVIHDQHFFNGLTTGAKNIKVTLLGVDGEVSESIKLDYDHYLHSYSNKEPTVQVEDASSGHFAFADLLFETTPNSVVTVKLVRTGKEIELDAPNGLFQVGRADLVSFNQIYNDDQLIITSTAPNGEVTTINHTVTISALDGYSSANEYTYKGYYLPKFKENLDNTTIKLDVVSAKASTDKFAMLKNGKLVLDSKDGLVEADTIANAKVYLSWVDADGQQRAIESKSDASGHVIFNVQSMLDASEINKQSMIDGTNKVGQTQYGSSNDIVGNKNIIKGLTTDVAPKLTVIDPTTNESRTVELKLTADLYVEQFKGDVNNPANYFEGEGGLVIQGTPANLQPFESADTDLIFLATNNAKVTLTHVTSGEVVSLVATNGMVTFNQSNFTHDIKTNDEFLVKAELGGYSTSEIVIADSPYYDNNVVFELLDLISEGSNTITTPYTVDDFKPTQHTFNISGLLENRNNDSTIDEFLKINQIGDNSAEVYIDRDGDRPEYQPELLLVLNNTQTPFELDMNTFMF